jgi:hypothetical protein
LLNSFGSLIALVVSSGNNRFVASFDSLLHFIAGLLSLLQILRRSIFIRSTPMALFSTVGSLVVVTDGHNGTVRSCLFPVPVYSVPVVFVQFNVASLCCRGTLLPSLVGLFPYLSIASIIAPVTTGLSSLLALSVVEASTASTGCRMWTSHSMVIDSLAADPRSRIISNNHIVVTKVLGNIHVPCNDLVIVQFRHGELTFYHLVGI